MVDFRTWSHDNLADFAKQCWLENIALRNDVRLLLDTIRAMHIETMDRDTNAEGQGSKGD